MARARATAAAPSPAGAGAAGGDEKAAALAATEVAAKAGAEAAADAAPVDGAWELPVIDSFPVTLVLENASPSARTMHGIGLYMAANETKSVEFTEEQFAKFSRYIVQIALLNGWRKGHGLIIEIEGEKDGED